MTTNPSLAIRPRDAICVVRLDRLIFNGWQRQGVQDVPHGYRRISDVRPYGQGVVVNYGRVRTLLSTTNSAKITIAYKPLVRWVAPHRVTMFADDSTGLTAAEVRGILSRYDRHVLSVVELAVDFHPNAGVDRDFVLRHGRFGKSRRRSDRGGPESLRYGGQSCPKLVRCYTKKNLNCFRVEVELHRLLLRNYQVENASDLGRVAVITIPAHLTFVSFRWSKLRNLFYKKFAGEGAGLFDEARCRANHSLRSATKFLTKMGLSNPHRFLAPHSINREIRLALRIWAEPFSPYRWE